MHTKTPVRERRFGGKNNPGQLAAVRGSSLLGRVRRWLATDWELAGMVGGFA